MSEDCVQKGTGPTRIAPVGYINPERVVAMISVSNPPLLNASADFVQIVLTIADMKLLHQEIGAFLKLHADSLH